MDAIVSGRAGIAVIFDGLQTFYLRSNDTSRQFSCTRDACHRLFGDATDLEFLIGTQFDSVVDRLGTASSADIALHLTLSMLDPTLTADCRLLVMVELNFMLVDQRILNSVKDIIYAAPFTPDIDAIGAAEFARSKSMNEVINLCEEALLLQDHIVAVRTAWDMLPSRLFPVGNERPFVQSIAVRAGLFHNLVGSLKSERRSDLFLSKAFHSQSFRTVQGYRNIAQHWLELCPSVNSDRMLLQHNADEMKSSGSTPIRASSGVEWNHHRTIEYGRIDTHILDVGRIVKGSTTSKKLFRKALQLLTTDIAIAIAYREQVQGAPEDGILITVRSVEYPFEMPALFEVPPKLISIAIEMLPLELDPLATTEAFVLRYDLPVAETI